MTLGDLLRQEGALALLVIGAVIGFLANIVFRAFIGKKKLGILPKVSENAVAPEVAFRYTSASGHNNSAAVIAAVSAAINKYRNKNS